MLKKCLWPLNKLVLLNSLRKFWKSSWNLLQKSPKTPLVLRCWRWDKICKPKSFCKLTKSSKMKFYRGIKKPLCFWIILMFSLLAAKISFVFMPIALEQTRFARSSLKPAIFSWIFGPLTRTEVFWAYDCRELCNATSCCLKLRSACALENLYKIL